MTSSTPHVVIIGAGVGGLTTAGLLAKSGYKVTLIESNTYPGGSAGTFFHKGYRFDAGATVVGGFQPDGPHDISGKLLNIDWNVKEYDPAWVVHLPDRIIKQCQDGSDLIRNFPETERFWAEQNQVASLAWRMSAQGLPFPPENVTEFAQLAGVGLRNFPTDLKMLPFALTTVRQWAHRHQLTQNKGFIRFLDAQLLISAQTTSPYVNALYGATALDLPRQGVVNIAGGTGGLSEQLADKFVQLGGEILYRHTVSRITIDNGFATGIFVTKGKRSTQERFIPADFVIANTTPWSLNNLLAEDSPAMLQREVTNRQPTQGAFVLHIGLRSDTLPPNTDDHHQIVTGLEGPLGEGRSIFVSISPEWDSSRAPEGFRAVTVSTHTDVSKWWNTLEDDPSAYAERKDCYAEKMIETINSALPGFKSGITMMLTGTPVTYQFYTQRALGMVGGFPQTSLFKARGPKTGIPNVRLVGDSIFPGQSTAGVTLGAIRVANQVTRALSDNRFKHRKTFS